MENPRKIQIDNDFSGDKTEYELIPVKTHKIGFGESIAEALKKYAIPHMKEKDWLALSEKVVSVGQNNVRHISTVKAGWLAKLLVKGVKKYPNDIGYERPEKMQVAVEMAGVPRMLVAGFVGGIGKLMGIRGLFWRIAGNRVSEIDGFNPDAMYPYTEYAILPPLEPERTTEELEKETGHPVTIIDANNIDVQVIAKSPGLDLSKYMVRKILKSNPMGQDNEMTPFVIVRQVASLK